MTSPPQTPRPLLSLRSFVLIAVAIAVALATGWLTYMTQPSMPTALFAAGVSFAAALKLLNDLIE